MFFWDWTYILIFPGLLLGLWAQHKVKSTYEQYSRVGTRLGQPASAVVGDVVDCVRNLGKHIGCIWDAKDAVLSDIGAFKQQYFVRAEGDAAARKAEVEGAFGEVSVVECPAVSGEFAFVTG